MESYTINVTSNSDDTSNQYPEKFITLGGIASSQDTFFDITKHDPLPQWKLSSLSHEEVYKGLALKFKFITRTHIYTKEDV